MEIINKLYDHKMTSISAYNKMNQMKDTFRCLKVYDLKVLINL